MFMKAALNDIRGAFALILAILSLVGFIVLTITGDNEQGRELAALFGLPSITFLFGLGSDPYTDE